MESCIPISTHVLMFGTNVGVGSDLPIEAIEERGPVRQCQAELVLLKFQLSLIEFLLIKFNFFNNSLLRVSVDLMVFLSI